MTLSAIVLTRNEERNIAECLSSVSFAEEVLVVDSGSTDGTVVLAQEHGARVITRAFTDFASQRNFAMSEAKGDWVLFIDADERVRPELAEEIKAVLSVGGKASRHSDLALSCESKSEGRISPEILRQELAQADEKRKLGVYAIPRQNFFFGRRLRFGDAREDAPIRLFPKVGVSWTQPVHEMIVTEFPIRKLKSPLLHYSTRDLDHYKQKIGDYIPLELETMRTKGLRPSIMKAVFLPPAKFIQLYLLKGGILDGIAGLQYAILSAYFYTLRKYWSYYQQKGRFSGENRP